MPQIEPPRPIGARSLLCHFQKGEQFKAAQQEQRIWDRNTPDRFEIVPLNRGNGFEEAISVESNGGIMTYVGPFYIENEPDERTMLLFTCQDFFFTRGITHS